MIENRRKPEASALRKLFHEQLDYLNQLVGKWDERQQANREMSEEVNSAIEDVISGTDARMRSVSSYKTQLRDSVRSVLAYIDEMVAELPQAVCVDQKAFSHDPLVNSLFVNKQEIQQIFSHCQKLHDFFAATENHQLEEVFVILFVTMHEKTVLGKKMDGDMILGDVMQVAVDFSQHQIVYPEATEELVRKSLENMLFDSVVEYTKMHLTKLSSEQLRQADIRLNLDDSLRNPEIYLQTLTEHLSHPQQLLQQENKAIKLSKMKIRLSEGDTETANEFHLHTVKVGDQASRVIVLVRYPKNELLSSDNLFNP